jgi:hypothetical protein
MNKDKYQIVDKDLKEVLPIDIFLDVYPDYAEKYYAQLLAEYLKIKGKSKIKILEWLLRNKDKDNYISSTLARVSAECNVTIPTVVSVFNILYKNKLIEKKSKGLYKLSDDIYKDNINGIAIVKIWSKVNE